MIADAYIRKATVFRILDGDTFELTIHLGYRVYVRELIRLRNYNAPELPTVAGLAAVIKVTALLTGAKEITVRSYKDHMTFARWVADIFIDGVSLAELMQRPDDVPPAPI